MNLTEPPSPSSVIVLIGKNGRGQWVAQHQDGLFGGLFTHFDAAMRYALFENGHRRDAVITIGCMLELDMTATSAIARALPPPSLDASHRAA